MNKILRNGIIATIILGTVGTSGFYNYTYAKGDGAVEEGEGAKADGSYSVAIGYNASADAIRDIAIGDSSKASEDSSVAIGYKAKASKPYAIAIGVQASAALLESIAIGSSANAKGIYSIALGTGAEADGLYSVALGQAVNAKGEYSVALGKNAIAFSKSSVAIGFGSKANDEYEFSVGKDVTNGWGDGYPAEAIYRRITHVADGVNDNDAVTVEQLNTKADKSELSSYMKISDLSSYAKTTDLETKANVDLDNLTTDGTNKVKTLAGEQITATVTQDFVTEKVKKGNVSSTTLDVTGDGKMVGSDLKIDLKDGIVTKKKLSSDLKTEIENKANASALSAYAKKDATNITGESLTKWQSALGNGTIAENNKGLVTGETVHTALKGKANVDLDNLTENGTNKVKTLAGDQINATVTQDFVTEKVKKGNLTSDTLDVKGTGKLVDSNLKIDLKDGIVTKKKLSNELKTEIENKANTTDLNAYAKTDATNITGESLTKWQSALGNGTIAENNKGLVTGGTVYTALQGKADKNAKNIEVLAWKKKLGLVDAQATQDSTNDIFTQITNINKDITNLKGGFIVSAGTKSKEITLGGTTKDKLTFASSDKNLTATFNDTTKTISYGVNVANLIGDINKSDTKITNVDLTNNQTVKNLKTEIQNITGGSGTTGSLSTKADTNANNLKKAEDILAWQKKLGLADNSATVQPGSTATTNLFTTVNQLKAGYTVKAGTNTFDMKLGDTTAPTIEFAGDSTNGLDVAADKAGKKITYAINKEKLVKYIAGDLIKQMNGEGTGDSSGHGTGKQGQTTPLPVLTNVSTGFNIAVGSDSKNFTFGKGKETNKLTFAGTNDETSVSISGKDGTPTITVGLADTFKTKVNNKADKSDLNDYAKNSALTELETKVNNITNGTTNIDLSTNNTFKALQTSVEGKANKNADNITVSDWATKLGIGEVATGNANLVTGGKVFDAIKDKADKSALSDYAKNSAVTELETKVKNITNGTTKIDVKNIDLSTNNTFKTLQTSVEGKANADGSNVTAPNKWAEKLGTGEVAKDNKELVTGGKVYTAVQGKADKDAKNIEVLAWKKKLGLIDAQATQDSTTNISTQITNINNDITNLKGGFIVSAGTKSKEITLGGTTKDKLTFASSDSNLTATFDDTTKTIRYGVNVANLIGDINKSSTKITNVDWDKFEGINFYREGTSSGTTYTPSAKAEDKWQSSRIVLGEGLKAEELKDAGNNKYTKISVTGGGQGGKSAYEIWEAHKDKNGIQPNKGKSEEDFMNYMKGKDCSADIQHIADNVTKGLSSMDGRINRVSAGAAALSALRPISNEYDPDNKLDFSVGFGYYKGENAVAIGAYYRPDSNTIISLGGAFNGDDNLLNAGLSWKIGKTTPKENRQTQLQQEVDALKEKNGVMEKTIQEQNEKIKELEVLVRSVIHK